MIEDYDKVEKEFSGVNAFQCNHCGELVTPDGSIMEEHLDNCEKYQEKNV